MHFCRKTLPSQVMHFSHFLLDWKADFLLFESMLPFSHLNEFHNIAGGQQSIWSIPPAMSAPSRDASIQPRSICSVLYQSNKGSMLYQSNKGALFKKLRSTHLVTNDKFTSSWYSNLLPHNIHHQLYRSTTSSSSTDWWPRRRGATSLQHDYHPYPHPRAPPPPSHHHHQLHRLPHHLLMGDKKKSDVRGASATWCNFALTHCTDADPWSLCSTEQM